MASYKRILLKISGEGLSGAGGFGLTAEGLESVAGQILELHQMDIQIAAVVGAGNFIRGGTLVQHTTINRATADQLGMLATHINAIALKDILVGHGIDARVMSAFVMPRICEAFTRDDAIHHLDAGRVIILAGGTGNPFFTTDTCAALRASEIDADVLIKATKVDGVYNDDPMKNPDAKRFDTLTYHQVLHMDLKIMDHTAITLCRDNGIDIIVCNLMIPGHLTDIARGRHTGTVISS